MPLLTWAEMSCPRMQNWVAHSTINMAIFYGYIDQRPDHNTLDSAHSQDTVNKLLQPCWESTAMNFACGFQLVYKDILFWKLTKISGPYTFQIHIFASSMSANDQHNRLELYQQQNSISARNTRAFLEALEQFDVVLYQGHARYGYGPDFYPPEILKSGRTNKQFYVQHPQKSITALLTTLQQRSSSLPVLGLFSCTSSQHFGKALKKINKVDFTLLTRDLSYSSQLQQPLLQFLNNSLSQHCLTNQIYGFQVDY